jgi:hypothetical protein
MPFTTFDVNIFGTDHRDLDNDNNDGYSKEFVIHVLQVECNQTITNFDMFIEFYAYPFRRATLPPSLPPNDGLWINAFNIDNMKLNGRPQVIHLDSMTPASPVALYPTCDISPAPPCPSPADIRLCSMAFQNPILATSPTNYDTDYTDMYNFTTNADKLPVNITIIADGCRYSSAIGTTINIYQNYFGSAGLFGGSLANPNNYPIGFNEKITIS